MAGTFIGLKQTKKTPQAPKGAKSGEKTPQAPKEKE